MRIPFRMRWDYPLLDINPVFPGLAEIIIIIVIIIIIIIIIAIIIIIKLGIIKLDLLGVLYCNKILLT